VIADAYSNLSGTIDALKWILFVPVLWGLVFLVIFRFIRNQRNTSKSSENPKSKQSGHNKTAESREPLVSPVNDGWAIPMKSSGYPKGAGWHSDPSAKFHKRYFDGNQWTDQVRDKSTSSSQKQTAESNRTTFSNDRVSSSPNAEGLKLDNDSEGNGFASREISKEFHDRTSNSLTDELTKLVTFYEKGLLSKEEFDTAKQRLFLDK
jgi:hypothetical protein